MLTMNKPALLCVCVCLNSLVLGASGQSWVPKFDDILVKAHRLAEENVYGESDNLDKDQDQLLYSFTLEPKTSMSDVRHEQMRKLIDEFKQKAQQFIHEPKQTGWLSSIMSFLGPMKQMKKLSENYPDLELITKRYEAQPTKPSEVDVECDLTKFEIKALDQIMFVLQIEVLELALGKRMVENIAIYRQLRVKKFLDMTNFYEQRELTASQQQLLLDFYLAHADPNSTSIREASEHVANVGNFIIGRLMSTCHSVKDFEVKWDKLEAARLAKCAQSKSDPEPKFGELINVATYQYVAEFCGKFIEAI